MKNIKRFRKLIAREFSLTEGKAEDEVIDAVIHQAANIQGPVAWALIFAIFIASVGLNVNSIAVLIGAMLISPLMGPIIGIGYGLAIYDFELLKKSFWNLVLTAFISIVVSFFYFWLTPLTTGQSVFLDRTRPSIWDVLIAFFGGMVGIIGLTRKEKSTIIPGVAIATAIMPPLCTAGYELTLFQWELFWGALYLFTINCVYIAFSTSIVVWLMKIPRKRYIKQTTQMKVARRLYLIAFLTILPSIYLTFWLVREEIFKHNARLVLTKFNFHDTYIANAKILPKTMQIELVLVGEPLSEHEVQDIHKQLNNVGLESASIIIHQADEKKLNSPVFDQTIVHTKSYQNTMQKLNNIERELVHLKAYMGKYEGVKEQKLNIEVELKKRYPELNQIILTSMHSKADKLPVIIFSATSTRKLTASELHEIKQQLQFHYKSENIKIHINVLPKDQ